MRLEFFRIDKLNFVEFNITGDDLNCHRLNDESHYLGSEVFNLFVHCFEKSNDLYEYFEPSKFNSRKIVVLKNELIINLEKWDNIKSSEGFVNFVEAIFLGKAFLIELDKMDADWAGHWELYLSFLKEINREMMAIIDKCIDESNILWVIGY
jgi:hypothetical protein